MAALLLLRATPTMAAEAALPAAAESSHGEVTIYRDGKGVPHIEGATSAAVLYGQGYALAQDRLAQMELTRRSKSGRRAEILGPRLLAADKEARSVLQSPDELMRLYRAIPREHQLMMKAFVDGINRHIADVLQDPAHKLPYEFTKWGLTPSPWTLVDFLAVVAGPHSKSYELDNLAFLNAMTKRYGAKIGRRIFDDVVPIDDLGTPTVIAPGEDLAPARPLPTSVSYPPSPLTKAMDAFTSPPSAAEGVVGASRCLVIGPGKSASGNPLLLEATSDGPESNLHGGGFDTAGFSQLGWGAITMGRSLDHGWLMTSGHGDTADIYAERLNPANPHQYWFDGKWRDMAVHTETIAVKGAAPVAYEVAVTTHGPVLQWDVAHGVAYAERYAERGHELDTWVGLIEMARARTLDEFQAKGIARVAWDLGVCYAGRDGHIAYWEAGRLPKRPANVDNRLPTPGTGAYEWQGFLSFEEKPRVIDPKQGYIHVWNSKATTWMPEGDDARIGETFRTWLGNRLATAATGVTLLDMREFNRKIWNAEGARDRAQTSPDFFAPYILEAVAKSGDPEVRQAAAQMLAFNGLYEDLDQDGFYDSPGAPLFRAWLEIAPDMIFGPAIGRWWKDIDADRYHKYQTSLLLRAIQGSRAPSPLRFDFFQGRDRDAVIAATIRKTIDQLKPQYPGRDMKDWHQPIFWKYLDATTMDPAKPLMPNEDKFFRTSAKLGYGPKVVKHHGGEAWVGLMELDPGPKAIFTVTEVGGQNQFIDPQGHGNPHLVDQVTMHANNELKRIDMAPDVVKRTAESVTKLLF